MALHLRPLLIAGGTVSGSADGETQRLAHETEGSSTKGATADDKAVIRESRSFPHTRSSIPDPGAATLERDRLRASNVMACLKRAADVHMLLTLNSVTFEWPHDSPDALFVFEAVTGREP